MESVRVGPRKQRPKNQNHIQSPKILTHRLQRSVFNQLALHVGPSKTEDSSVQNRPYNIIIPLHLHLHLPYKYINNNMKHWQPYTITIFFLLQAPTKKKKKICNNWTHNQFDERAYNWLIIIIIIIFGSSLLNQKLYIENGVLMNIGSSNFYKISG